MISDDYMNDHVRAMEDRIEELKAVRDELIDENEQLKEEHARLHSYCELLIDALDAACDYMRDGDVARLRQRHPIAMEVIV